MSDFWKIESASQNQMRSISNVANIIQALRDLLSEKYPHIVSDDIVADISYEGFGESASFRSISFSANNNESIVVNAHRICLNSEDGIKYVLFEYENGIEDIFYCKQEDLKMAPIGPTNFAEIKKKSEEDLCNNLICAIGTMLPTAVIMSMSSEQVDESAKKIAQYLLNKNCIKGDYMCTN